MQKLHYCIVDWSSICF